MEEAPKELFLKEGRSEVLLAYSPGWHERRRLIWFQGEGSANLADFTRVSKVCLAPQKHILS